MAKSTVKNNDTTASRGFEAKLWAAADALAAIERDNPSLKGVLSEDRSHLCVDKQRRAEIVNLVSDIALDSAADRAKGTLGRLYEYFVARFASAAGEMRRGRRDASWSDCTCL